MNKDIEFLIKRIEIKDFKLWIIKNFDGKQMQNLLNVVKQYEESRGME